MEEALKRTFAIGIAALALGGFAASATAAPTTWGSSSPLQVCHATGSTTNPYVLINPAGASTLENRGHGKHGDKIGSTSVTRAATPAVRGASSVCSAPDDGGDSGDGEL
jgi:hypothetical protein